MSLGGMSRTSASTRKRVSKVSAASLQDFDAPGASYAKSLTGVVSLLGVAGEAFLADPEAAPPFWPDTEAAPPF